MHNVMILTKWLDKKIPRYEGDNRYMYGSNVLGMSPKQLENCINKVLTTFKDPVFIGRDGSNHDSH
jgi:hypothetical protein